jgi:hypothetical protein
METIKDKGAQKQDEGKNKGGIFPTLLRGNIKNLQKQQNQKTEEAAKENVVYVFDFNKEIEEVSKKMKELKKEGIKRIIEATSFTSAALLSLIATNANLFGLAEPFRFLTISLTAISVIELFRYFKASIELDKEIAKLLGLLSQELGATIKKLESYEK